MVSLFKILQKAVKVLLKCMRPLVALHQDTSAAAEDLYSFYEPIILGPIATQLDSRLLSLPGELRNKIYEYVLADYIVRIKPLHPISDWDPIKYPVQRHEPGRHPLRQVCRQIFEETRRFPVDDAVFDLRNARYADTVMCELWKNTTCYVGWIVLTEHQAREWMEHADMYRSWFDMLWHVEVIDEHGSLAKRGITAQRIAAALSEKMEKPDLSVDVVDFPTYPHSVDIWSREWDRRKKLDPEWPEAYMTDDGKLDWDKMPSANGTTV